MVKNPPANAGDRGDTSSISWSGSSPGGRHGNPLQNSSLENPLDRGGWQATVHRVVKSWTQLKQLSTHICMKFIGASQAVLVLKNLPANAGEARDVGLIPWWGTATEEKW